MRSVVTVLAYDRYSPIGHLTGPTDVGPRTEVPVTGLLMLAGAALLLAAGAEAFAEHAAAAGRRIGATGVMVGLLLAGAEPEEVVTAVTAGLRDRPGLALGDAIGANITLATLVLGALALITAIRLAGRIRAYVWTAAGAAATAAVAVVTGAAVTPTEGLVLLVVYALTVAALWVHDRRPPAIGEIADLDDDAASGADDRRAATTGLLIALAGVAVMGLGGWLAIAGAERVVSAFELTDTSVGLTLVALATTGEFVALVVATARRGITDVAVAAVFGSVLYNATVTLGAAATVAPLPADHPATVAALAAAVLPVAALALAGARRILGRPAALALLSGYAVFLATTIG
jgi:cation:H+ antiporter